MRMNGFKCDWLEITEKPEVYNNSLSSKLIRFFDEMPNSTPVPQRGRYGYKIAREWFGGCVRIDAHEQEFYRMGVHWTFSGKANDYVQGGLLILLSQWARHGVGVSASRIDLAFDCYNPLDLEQLEKHLLQEMERGNIRKRSITAYRTQGQVESININKRTSDVYGRLYDKAREQGLLGTEWKRIEFMLRGRMAKSVMREVIEVSRSATDTAPITGYLMQIWLGLTRDYYGEEILALSGALTWGLTPLFFSRGKHTDPYHWLNTTVATAVAKAISQMEQEQARVWLHNWINNEILARSKHRDILKFKSILIDKINMKR